LVSSSEKDAPTFEEAPEAMSQEAYQALMIAMEKMESHHDDNEKLCILEEEDPTEQLLAGVNEAEKVKVTVAMDSGAVRNVVRPDDLPKGVFTVPNSSGQHFVGPAGEKIMKHGTCVTAVEGKRGKLGCNWAVADVTRTLNAVSQTTGPEEHATGHHDVLFNNKRCVVVPPGIVERVMRAVQPIAEYKRHGGLYLAELELSCMPKSGFTRQGANQ